MTIETITNDQERIYKLSGKLDTLTSNDLKKATADLSDITTVIFDLEKLSYISSAGIRVILECLRKMNAVKGKVIVRNPNEIVKDVFDMTGFSDLLTIEENE